jgi:hypothetical protein
MGKRKGRRLWFTCDLGISSVNSLRGASSWVCLIIISFKIWIEYLMSGNCQCVWKMNTMAFCHQEVWSCGQVQEAVSGDTQSEDLKIQCFESHSVLETVPPDSNEHTWQWKCPSHYQYLDLKIKGSRWINFLSVQDKARGCGVIACIAGNGFEWPGLFWASA